MNNSTIKFNKPKLLLQHYLGDIIYGANDGIVTTFTIISGAQGADLSYKVIIILGIINLLADGLSMGTSRYLSIRSKVAAFRLNRTVSESSSHGIVTFIAFVGFGIIPLICFFLPGFENYQFTISILVCLITLFFAGSLRYFINKKQWWRTGFEMAIIGGSTALLAYSIGYGLKYIII